MPLLDSLKNPMLETAATLVGYVSLHSGAPGRDGANELSGGSPAYRRKAITWDRAASGSLSDSSNGIDFDVPAGARVVAVGLWSTESSGTFYGFGAVDEETYNRQGTYTLRDFTIPASDPS